MIEVMTKRGSCAAVIAFALMTMASTALAGTFRLTTKVYSGADLKPAAEHRIVFDQGLVYDLPQIQSRFVTVYDEAQNRVTILDRQTQVQTVLSTTDLEKITAAARAAAVAPQEKAKLGLLAQVEPSDRVIGYKLKFESLEYHVTTQAPEDESIASDYGRFTILASRLNLVRRLGPPPFGRMTLSQYIAAKGELPMETTLTLRRENQRQEFRSTLELEELTEEDKKKIDEVREMLVLYREVDLNQFPN